LDKNNILFKVINQKYVKTRDRYHLYKEITKEEIQNLKSSMGTIRDITYKALKRPIPLTQSTPSNIENPDFILLPSYKKTLSEISINHLKGNQFFKCQKKIKLIISK
jgi:hypothetical protein